MHESINSVGQDSIQSSLANARSWRKRCALEKERAVFSTIRHFYTSTRVGAFVLVLVLVWGSTVGLRLSLQYKVQYRICSLDDDFSGKATKAMATRDSSGVDNRSGVNARECTRAYCYWLLYSTSISGLVSSNYSTLHVRTRTVSRRSDRIVPGDRIDYLRSVAK